MREALARSDRDFVMDENDASAYSRFGALLRLVLERPGEVAGSIALVGVAGVILANALFWQQGQHPAPLFRAQERQAEAAPALRTPIPPPPEVRTAAPQSAPVAPIEGADPLVRALQTELAARGHDVGVIDGVIGPKTDAAIRAFQTRAGLPADGVPSASLLSRIKAARAAPAQPAAPAADPIAELLRADGPTPDARLLIIERSLVALGYGPMKIDGIMSPETRRAIEQFERDEGLPVTGAASARLVRELSTAASPPVQ